MGEKISDEVLEDADELNELLSFSGLLEWPTDMLSNEQF